MVESVEQAATPEMARPLAGGGPIRSLVYAAPDGSCDWIDVIAPDRTMLLALSEEYGLPASAIEDYLDPRQLPKFERFGDRSFMILRLHVDAAPDSAASSHELTQPLAIFAGPRFLLTIHRREHGALARMRLRVRRTVQGPLRARDLLDNVVLDAMQTFSAPLEHISTELEASEASLLRSKLTDAVLEHVFIRRRRAVVLATLVERTRDVLVRSYPLSERTSPNFLELRELAEELSYRARELIAYTDNLMNLQIAVASHHTNEIVRVLTLMSAVFMPLTFIVGVYGMNFDLPEFAMPHGYLAAYALIIAVSGGVLLWFRRRGWLG